MGRGRDNVFGLVGSARETGMMPRDAWRAQAQFPTAFVKRLRLEGVLKGHRGCVNRLAWNEEGTMLASGSDDRCLNVWRYPDITMGPVVLSTNHHANIFGVKFLPCTNNTQLVSGAMDTLVIHHRLDSAAMPVPGPKGSDSGMVRHPAGGAVRVTPHEKVYQQHSSRVKAVEVEPLNPHNFWSASEDGTVRQFDTRADVDRNVLVLVGNGSRPVECKHVAINRARSPTSDQGPVRADLRPANARPQGGVEGAAARDDRIGAHASFRTSAPRPPREEQGIAHHVRELLLKTLNPKP